MSVLIGADMLHYAKINRSTSSDNYGDETYDTPIRVSGLMSLNLTNNYSEASIYTDDMLDTYIKEFSSGTISVNVKNLPVSVLVDWFGAKQTSSGGIVFSGEDTAKDIAIGFRARKANGKYRYFWLYSVRMGVPAGDFTTKGESVTFNTPTIEGVYKARTKTDANGNHPYWIWLDEDAESSGGTLAGSAVKSWFTQVPEPEYSAG